MSTGPWKDPAARTRQSERIKARIARQKAGERPLHPNEARKLRERAVENVREDLTRLLGLAQSRLDTFLSPRGQFIAKEEFTLLNQLLTMTKDLT